VLDLTGIDFFGTAGFAALTQRQRDLRTIRRVVGAGRRTTVATLPDDL
jgi:anti-anti-sigma regulatory factor